MGMHIDASKAPSRDFHKSANLQPEKPELATRDLTVRFGGHVAVNGVTCAFQKGDLTAIVGPNGAGKTTYFNLISGQIKATRGEVFLQARDITGLSPAARANLGLGRAFQLTNLFPALSVFGNIRLAVQSRYLAKDQSKHQSTQLDKHSPSAWQSLWRVASPFSLARDKRGITGQSAQILADCGLEDVAEQEASSLSHGNQRKLEVAMLLALDSQIMMFDEPTAGMSHDEAPLVLDLIAKIKAKRTKTILLVEHKMDVLESLADRIVVLHNGSLIADGEPSKVMGLASVQEAYLGKIGGAR